MKLLAILVFVFLAFFTSPVLARGSRCRSSTQCDYESVCDNGYCYTIDEMFEKYEFNGNSGRTGRNGGRSGNNEYDGNRRFYKRYE
ncbi:hypothetical protein CAEBREN_24684 [Caenorhabditis brenneri]|uniref:Uncharacterized protein n=1 Tax=Caenorhabditis brenneri TaxID=135651 RepID=G0PAQ3_CAEBE|nr:hypothetical protein CAEBREN_24684 [Caenorhabditis brenneri]